MEIEVYADLLFLVNAGMDWMCFTLTGWVLHRKLSGWRTAIGAALGGMYAVASLLFDVGRTTALGLDLAVCLLICAVVFAEIPPSGREIGAATATYFVLSMLLGGVITALYNLLNRLRLPEHLPSDEEGPSAWLFVILALTGSAITLWGGRAFRRSTSVRLCSVTVTLDGRQVTLEGMVDTGNLLRDPLSGRAVICAEKAKLSAILSPALTRALESGGIESLTSHADAKRFRLIPAGTATGQGILTGFLPDRVVISYTRKSREETRSVDAVIACTALTDTEALVPAELIG